MQYEVSLRIKIWRCVRDRKSARRMLLMQFVDTLKRYRADSYQHKITPDDEYELWLHWEERKSRKYWDAE